MSEPRHINLEPNWKGLREWAIHGLRGAKTQKERNVFAEILNSCDHARLAGRPDTGWDGDTWPEDMR